MSEHATHRTIERHCDVLVVGGSAAGLAAAVQIGRQARAVIVVDAGEPRNAPAAHMHGYLGRDGSPPAALLADGRAEVRRYGGEVLDGRVDRVSRDDDGSFRAELVGGHAVVARRVLVATGLVDDLPDIEGVADEWGRSVIHCPFCHGYEVRDRTVVQIVTHPMGLHPTSLFRQLTADLTVVVHDDVDVDDDRLVALREGGVAVRRARVHRVLARPGGGVASVELADGTSLPAEAVVIGPRFRARVEPFADLGLRSTPHPSGLGDVVETDATGATSIPGVHAAGNVTDPSHQVLHAAADGTRVGAMICFALADEDLRAGARPSALSADWERRYEGDPMWSGNPNGSLVAEVAGLAPGRALDVGAGEGGDAIFLAEAGWEVTANDISGRALDRLRGEAERRGLRVECLRADANAAAAFGSGAYDLVSAQYASIPRTGDDRGVHNLIGAVAPGGTLVVVSHDLEPMRVPVDTTTHSRPFDPDAYVRVEDVVAVLEQSPAWEIQVHERRPRPTGSATAAHHVDDVVLRARRSPS